MTSPPRRLRFEAPTFFRWPESLGALYLMGRRSPNDQGPRPINHPNFYGLAAATPRIEPIAQGVPKDIDGDQNPNQHKPGQDRDPPGAREHEVIAGADQRAEGGLGHRHAKPQ